MGHDDQRAGEIHQEILQPRDGAVVKVVRRFVQQQERRLLRQRTGEHDLLPLAAGEPVEEPAAHILQIQIAHGLVYDVVVM